MRLHCVATTSLIPMQTSYRDIALLACCQALLLVNNAGLIAMNGLVGYALVDNKTFATLGVTSYVLGSAFAAMPAALYMARVGRRRGFMTGSLIAVVGSATCALGHCAGQLCSVLLWHRDRRRVHGIRPAVSLRCRRGRGAGFRAKAISLVLAGGIVGGFVGPTASLWAKDLYSMPFLGSFLVLSVIALRRARCAVAGPRFLRHPSTNAWRRTAAARHRFASRCSSSRRSRRRWATAS